MKVKVIAFATGETFEEYFNDWLSDNPDIDIKFVAQSECVDDDGFYRITVSVWYTEVSMVEIG